METIEILFEKRASVLRKSIFHAFDSELYSFSNITDDFSKWTKITLKLANLTGSLNQIYSFTQLNDGSFIAIGPQGVLYQTTDPTLQTGWVLVNNNQQFISITEIIS